LLDGIALGAVLAAGVNVVVAALFFSLSPLLLTRARG
jgi:hypothetical protein